MKLLQFCLSFCFLIRSNQTDELKISKFKFNWYSLDGLVMFWSQRSADSLLKMKTCVNEPLAQFQSIHSNRNMHDEGVVPSLQFAAWWIYPIVPSSPRTNLFPYQWNRQTLRMDHQKYTIVLQCVLQDSNPSRFSLDSKILLVKNMQKWPNQK